MGRGCGRLTRCFTLRACFKIAWGSAARDFGCGQGGEGASARAKASPQRAGRTEPTPAAGKRPAALRVFAEKAVWLCCSSVEDPPGIFSFVAPRQTAFSAKTGPHGILKQALRVSEALVAQTASLLCRRMPSCELLTVGACAKSTATAPFVNRRNSRFTICAAQNRNTESSFFATTRSQFPSLDEWGYLSHF